MGVLLNQQAAKAAEHWGSELQITVWLCKDRDQNAACVGEVTDAQKDAIEKVVQENPEVAGYHFESKDEAFEKLKDTYAPGKFDGPNSVITAEDMPESLWIELEDPEQFEGITSAVVGLDGVSGIRDARDTLKPIYGAIDALKWGALATALFHDPAILIADEPTGNLDPTTSVGIMKLLDRINRTGTTVVMATHDHGVVDQMRKRVVELSAGQVVRDQAQGGYGFSH